MKVKRSFIQRIKKQLHVSENDCYKIDLLPTQINNSFLKKILFSKRCCKETLSQKQIIQQTEKRE